MTPELRGRVWKLILNGSLSSNRSTLPLSIRSCSFSSIDFEGGGGARQQAVRGEQVTNSAPDNAFARSTPEHAGLNNNDNHDIGYNSDRRREDRRRTYNTGCQNPPDPIPNRPLRGEKPSYEYEHLSHGNHGLRRGRGWGYDKSTAAVDTTNQKRKPVGLGENRTGRQSPSTSSDLFLFEKFGNDDKEENMKKQNSPYSQPQLSPFLGEKQDHDFLEKFKLGFNKEEKHIPEAAKPPLGKQGEEMKAAAERPHPPQDADAIFKKMKETGLIPNAVAMLDGLCKDGLVQEAMKLFGLMREKGTIPEVVIYTAVVEGFCKAQKLDDAKRIFKKMQNNGISPNAFSYTVLIQGLYKGKRLEDALDFCVEMLEAGHSLNLTTFAGLVDGFCREKGLEEAQSIIGILRQKGFSFDEKAVREYLDKKGPFLPLVWEAIVGKKSSHISF